MGDTDLEEASCAQLRGVLARRTARRRRLVRLVAIPASLALVLLVSLLAGGAAWPLAAWGRAPQASWAAAWSRLLLGAPGRSATRTTASFGARRPSDDARRPLGLAAGLLATSGDNTTCLSPWDQQVIPIMPAGSPGIEADDSLATAVLKDVFGHLIKAPPGAILGSLGDHFPSTVWMDMAEQECSVYPNVDKGFCNFQTHNVVQSYGSYAQATAQDEAARLAYGRLCGDELGARLVASEVCAIALSMALCTQAMPPCSEGGYTQRCTDVCNFAKQCSATMGGPSDALKCFMACSASHPRPWPAWVWGIIYVVSPLLAIAVCVVCLICLGEICVSAAHAHFQTPVPVTANSMNTPLQGSQAAGAAQS